LKSAKRGEGGKKEGVTQRRRLLPLLRRYLLRERRRRGQGGEKKKEKGARVGWKEEKGTYSIFQSEKRRVFPLGGI